MIAKELIDPAVRPLQLSDPVGIVMRSAGGVRSLPVVSEGDTYEGIIHRDNLPFGISPETIVKSVRAYLLTHHVHPQSHPFEIIKLWVEHPIEIFPVVAENQRYVGAVSLRSLRKFLTLLGPFYQASHAFEVNLPQRPYAFRDIIQVLEGNQIRILFIAPLLRNNDSQQVVIAVPEYQYYDALAALFRHGYQVAEYDGGYNDEWQKRIEYFQRLLEI